MKIKSEPASQQQEHLLRELDLPYNPVVRQEGHGMYIDTTLPGTSHLTIVHFFAHIIERHLKLHYLSCP